MNSLMSSAQVVVSGVLLFVLYSYLVRALGIERLGVFSVVMAATSLANIANLGFSGGSIIFVARYRSRGEAPTALKVIDTSVMTVGAVMGVVVLVLYFLSEWVLAYIMPAEHLAEALALMPYSLGALWLTLVTAVYHAGLDGCQRIDVKSWLLITSNTLNLILCFALVPRYGLMGVAYARLLQALALLVVSALALRRYMEGFSLLPRLWDFPLLKEMLGYNVNFQAISICQLCLDPVTKAILAKLGGLEITGYYEMAGRMVMQLRTILVSASTALVPSVAYEGGREEVASLYDKSYRTIYALSLPYYAAIAALAPAVSLLWVGSYKGSFVFIVVVIAVAYFFNTIISPSYMIYMGLGNIRWNTRGHLLIAALNPALGLLFGLWLGSLYVVVGFALALVLGSLMIMAAYHREYGVPPGVAFPRESLALAALSVLAVAAAYALYYFFLQGTGGLWVLAALSGTLAVMLGPALWRHPLGPKLTRALAAALSRTA